MVVGGDCGYHTKSLSELVGTSVFVEGSSHKGFLRERLSQEWSITNLTKLYSLCGHKCPCGLGFDMLSMPVGRLLVSTTHHTPQGVLVGTP